MLRQARFRFCRSPQSGASACSRDTAQSFLSTGALEGTGSDPVRRRKMTQACAGAPEIMRCKLLNASSGCGIFDDIPEDLRGHPVSPDFASFVDRPEHPTGNDVRRFRPGVDDPLHPKWNRNRSNMPTLANQIRDRPMLLAQLNRGLL